MSSSAPCTPRNSLFEAILLRLSKCEELLHSDPLQAQECCREVQSRLRRLLLEGGWSLEMISEDPAQLKLWPDYILHTVGSCLRQEFSVHAQLLNHTSAEAIQADTETILLILNDPDQLAQFYLGKGVLLYDRGQYTECLNAYAQGMRYAGQLPDTFTAACLRQNEGNVYAEMGEYAKAIDCFQIARDYADNSKLPMCVALFASIVQNLGTLHIDDNDPVTAIHFFEEALELIGDHDPSMRSKVYSNLGTAHKLSGNPDISIQFFRQALALKEKVGDRSGTAFVQLQLGDVYHAIADFSTAKKCLLQAVKLCRELKHKRWLGRSLVHLGRLYLSQEFTESNLNVALGYLLEAESVAVGIEDCETLALASEGLSEVYEKMGRLKEALEASRRQLSCREQRFRDENNRRMQNLRVLFEVREVQQEAEHHRQRSLEYKRLLDEKNIFLGIASHDLKNPLGAIISMARDLRFMHDAEPDTIRLLNDIETSAEHMFDIVSDMLDLNRYESDGFVPHWEDCLLEEELFLAAESLALQAHRKNIEIEFAMPDQRIEFRADKLMLRQMVDNLVSNAIKYSPVGGKIKIGMSPEGNGWRFYVRDQGAGIPLNEQPRLFTRFCQLSTRPTAGESSTGLGLAIVKQLAEINGAKVGCNSQPKNGSEFWIYFPPVMSAE